MNGNEFFRRLSRLGRARGVEVQIDEEHGKGSHATLYFGERFTTIKDRRKEIRPSLLPAMLVLWLIQMSRVVASCRHART